MKRRTELAEKRRAFVDDLRLQWLAWTYATLILLAQKGFVVTKKATENAPLTLAIILILLMAGLRFLPVMGTRLPRTTTTTTEEAAEATYGTCNYYMDSSATAGGDGSIGSPWTIDTAFVKGTGGDTICVAQGSGTFIINHDQVYQTSSGTSAEELLVYRSYPGTDTSDAELAHFKFQTWYPDSTIQYVYISGSFVRVQGFEFYFDDWDGPNELGTPGDSSERISEGTDVPSDMALSGILNVPGHGSSLVYNICHDVVGCIGANHPADDDSLSWYGIIEYNVGYIGSDRPHGPGMYLSSDTVLAGRDSARTATKNLIFAQMRHGGQVYNTSAYDLGNIGVDSNVIWSNGIRSTDDSSGSSTRCLFVSGGRAWRDVNIRGNYCFVPNNVKSINDAAGMGGVYLSAGGATGDTNEVVVRDNWFFGHWTEIYDLTNLTWLSNTRIGEDHFWAIDTVGAASGFGGDWSEWTWDSTTIYRDETQTASTDSLASLADPSRRWGLTQFQDSTGFETNVDYNSGLPTDTSIVIINAGAHEDANNARGYILVMNWQAADSITIPADSIDLIIDSGDTYDIRHPHRLDSTLVSGTWDGGDIRLDMNTPFYPDMYGGNPYNLSTLNTAPYFNVFVIRKYWETGYQGWSQWASSAEVTFDTEASGDSTMNSRAIIYADSIDTNGDQVRVYFTAGDDTLHIDGASICVRSGSTDDCTATPTRLYFNGGDSTGIVVPTSTTKVSDPLDFSIYADSTYLVHTYMVHPYKSYGFVLGSGTNGYSVSGAAAGDLTLTQTVTMSGSAAFGLVPKIQVRSLHEN